MTSKALHCHICQTVLDDNESTIKQHLSSIHLSYRPYECINCKDKGDIFNTATVEAMDTHISTSHCATNSEEYRVIKDKVKETELNAAIEECRRLSTLKHPVAGTAVTSRLNPVPNGPADSADDARVPRDLKEDLRQVYVLPDSASPTSENLTLTDLKPENITTSRNTVESDNEIIQIDDDGEQTVVKQEYGQTSRNVVKSEIEIIQIDDDDEQTEVKRKRVQTLQDIAVEIVRPELNQDNAQSHNAPEIAETCAIIMNMNTDQASDNGNARLSKQNKVHIAVDSNVSGDITATAASIPIPIETPPLKRAIVPNTQIGSRASMPPIALQKPIRDEKVPLKLRLRYRKRIRYGDFEGDTETKRGRFSRTQQNLAQILEDNSLARSIDDGQNQQQHGFDESLDQSATDDNEENEYRLESDGDTLTSKTRSHDSKKENRRKSHKDKGQGNSVQTRTHASEKPFKCNKCNYATTKRSILTVHERTHSGERPYKCRSCKYTTAQSCNLIKHNRIHSGEKPFKCRFCKFTTSQSWNLTEHVRIHSGEKPFKCRFCKFASARSCNLIKHNRIHIGEKPFKCRCCQFASRYNESLNSHMNTQHKEFLKVSTANSKKNTERNVLKKSGLKG